MKVCVLMSIALVLFGCEATNVTTNATRTAQTAGENWKQHCTNCHGADGKGKTEEGKRLQVTDLTAPKFQEESRYLDMVRAIVDGVYDANGNERMRHFGDKLFAKEVHDLVLHIRSLKK